MKISDIKTERRFNSSMPSLLRLIDCLDIRHQINYLMYVEFDNNDMEQNLHASEGRESHALTNKIS